MSWMRIDFWKALRFFFSVFFYWTLFSGEKDGRKNELARLSFFFFEQKWAWRSTASGKKIRFQPSSFLKKKGNPHGDCTAWSSAEIHRWSWLRQDTWTVKNKNNEAQEYFFLVVAFLFGYWMICCCFVFVFVFFYICFFFTFFYFSVGVNVLFFVGVKKIAQSTWFSNSKLIGKS